MFIEAACFQVFLTVAQREVPSRAIVWPRTNKRRLNMGAAFVDGLEIHGGEALHRTWVPSCP